MPSQFDCTPWLDQRLPTQLYEPTPRWRPQITREQWCYCRGMGSRDQEKFFSALHRYIRHVVADSPSGELPQDMSEKSDPSDDMLSALNGIIREMVREAIRERSRSVEPHVLHG